MGTEIARIARAQEETRQFCAETRRREAPAWPFAIGGMIVGATLLGGGMALAKLVGV